jgi:hypothetical protein
MAAPRKYSDELRERATRMAIELLPGAGDELLRLAPQADRSCPSPSPPEPPPRRAQK